MTARQMIAEAEAAGVDPGVAATAVREGLLAEVALRKACRRGDRAAIAESMAVMRVAFALLSAGMQQRERS